MENASKALLMAASILIGVILLSIMAYLFLVMGSYAGSIEENMQAKANYEYNIKFQLYDDRKDLTAQDVKSICNMVEDVNARQDSKITINNGNGIKIELQDNLTQKVETTYKCKLFYNSDGKISNITITKN